MTRRAVTARGVLATALVLAVVSTGAACSGPEERTTPTSSSAPPGTTATTAPGPTCSTDDTRSFGPLAANPSPDRLPAGSLMAEIRARGRLRVGVSADTLQFGARNPISGRIEGFDIDMLLAVARAIFGTGLSDDEVYGRLEFRVMTYADRIPSLQRGDVDIVAHTMTINDCRWKRIFFSTEYYRSYQKVLVRKDLQASSIADLARSKVCVAQGSTNVELMKSTYPDVPRVEVPDLTDCLVRFQQGTVDAVTGDDTVLAGFKAQDKYARILEQELSEEPYGLGIADGFDHATDGDLARTTGDDVRVRQQVEFTRFVNGVLDQMRVDGTWKRSWERWLKDAFGEAPSPPQARYGRAEPTA